MEREHLDYTHMVRGVFETPFGPMDFALTEADHVSISAGSGGDKSPKIVVNNIAYSTNVHLFAKEDGSWQHAPDGGLLYMSRGGFGLQRDTSDAARRKASEGIIAAWEDFIFGKDYLRMEAEVVNLNNEIVETEKKLEEAKKVVSTIEDQKQALLQAEQDVIEARKEFGKQGGYPKPKDWSPLGRFPTEE